MKKPERKAKTVQKTNYASSKAKSSTVKKHQKSIDSDLHAKTETGSSFLWIKRDYAVLYAEEVKKDSAPTTAHEVIPEVEMAREDINVFNKKKDEMNPLSPECSESPKKVDLQSDASTLLKAITELKALKNHMDDSHTPESMGNLRIEHVIICFSMNSH